jgi:DNA repair protein RecN (Recombination protein N)
MLVSLTIRNVVLIEQVHLDFRPGLIVITGETGAGKSILLDALSLCLGARADLNLVRKGAEYASVTATFELPPSHLAFTFLASHDFSLAPNERLMLRRHVFADGRSRAYINDVPVTAGLIKHLSLTLLELHGQFAHQSLFEASEQRRLMDHYGKLTPLCAATRQAWQHWQGLEDERRQLEEKVTAQLKDATYLSDWSAELEELAPQVGEESRLVEERSQLQHHVRLAQAAQQAIGAIESAEGAKSLLLQADRALRRQLAHANGLFDKVLEALERSFTELEQTPYKR